MSKLAVVFCATVLFASAFGAILPNSDAAKTNVRIHDAKLRIEHRLREIREQIYISERDNEGVNWNIIEFFKKNVTDRYNEGLEIITRTMQRLGGNFEESKCKHYFDEYERFTRRVVDSLDECISKATVPVLESLNNAEHEAREEQSRLTKLVKVDDTLDSEVARVIGNVEKAFKRYVRLIDGSLIKKAVHSETPYDVFLKTEDRVFNSFLNCALRKTTNRKNPEIISV